MDGYTEYLSGNSEGGWVRYGMGVRYRRGLKFDTFDVFTEGVTRTCRN